MRLSDMYSQPGYLIRRLHQRSTAEFAIATDGLEITQIQLSILLAVAEFHGTDATRISELIGSDRTTIGQALARLEEKGLVRREIGMQDKRTKSLVITLAGQALAASVTPLVPLIGSSILKGLSAREQDIFRRLLTKAVASNEGDDAVGRK